ncbi:hypothetical protein ACFXPJ_14610 [Streptomyces goshikiensis]
MSTHVHADSALQAAARFSHVAALVVGLGAVLAVDWFALLWLLGRRQLLEITGMARSLQIPIWFGLAGLVLTGSFLRPDMGSTLTLVKLGLVLAVTANGLYAHWLGERLTHHPHALISRSLLIQSGVATAISQISWWGAALIGFLNSQD